MQEGQVSMKKENQENDKPRLSEQGVTVRGSVSPTGTS